MGFLNLRVTKEFELKISIFCIKAEFHKILNEKMDFTSQDFKVNKVVTSYKSSFPFFLVEVHIDSNTNFSEIYEKQLIEILIFKSSRL